MSEMSVPKGERMLQKADELGCPRIHTTDSSSKDKQLLLLDNVQFIYELALAQLELQTLGANMGQEINSVEFIIDYAEKIGFKLIKNIDKIIFGLYNIMQKENILIFQKVQK